MTRVTAGPRPFVPGTTGWTSADLDDPRIEQEWFGGRYEIIEGVLTTMPAAYYAGHGALGNLVFILQTHLKARGLPPTVGQDIDLIICDERVVRADAVYLSADDRARQRRAARAAGRKDLARTRVLIPPTLIIESISPGHEQHDEALKRRWYAGFGVPNYWLLNAFDRSLRCLELHEGEYRVDTSGRSRTRLRPGLFPGLVIPLSDVWANLD